MSGAGREAMTSPMPVVGNRHTIPTHRRFGTHAGHEVEVVDVNDLGNGTAEVLRRCLVDGDEWRVTWHPEGAPDDD